MGKSAILSAAKAERVAKRRDYSETLPAYQSKACEFSDDPSLTDRQSVIRLIQKHLSGGSDEIGTLWDSISEQANLAQEGGRKRKPGDWGLAAVAYVMSRTPELYAFWDDELTKPLWQQMGFETRPTHSTLWLRMAELEDEQCIKAFEDAADKLIQLARAKEPRVGRDVLCDATAMHSRARLHHDCADPVACVALMKEQGKRVPKTLAIAAEELVRTARHADAEKPEEEMEGKVHPHALKDAKDQEGYYKHYVEFNGHRYGLLDPDAGVRAYGGKSSGKHFLSKFWVGGLDLMAVDHFTGGALANVIVPADRQEYDAFFPLMRRVERALGGLPETMSGDRGLGVTKVYRRCTLRGVAPIFPFRAYGSVKNAGQLRSPDLDEHVPRCLHCGAPGTIIGARLGMQRKVSGALVLRYRCDDPHAPNCLTEIQRLNMPTGSIKGSPAENRIWRLAFPLSPLTERYHALSTTGFSFERTFHHQRLRYRTLGNDLTGKIKRFGLGAHRLRCAIARFVEWFRICLRNGWLGDHPKVNTHPVLFRRGEQGLKKVLTERRRQGVNLPYGPAAHALGIRRTPDIPPWIPPRQRK